jgi:hypothetical protein
MGLATKVRFAPNINSWLNMYKRGEKAKYVFTVTLDCGIPLSDTVNKTFPAPMPEKKVLFDDKPVLPSRIVRGGTLPLTFKLIVPVCSPKHFGFVASYSTTIGGSKVTVRQSVHPAADVMETLCAVRCNNDASGAGTSMYANEVSTRVLVPPSTETK